MTWSEQRRSATEIVRAGLVEHGLQFDESGPGAFTATLPGERKLQTACSLRVGEQSLAISAFVVRNPDENREAVYRWLLERNLRLYAVAFAVDHAGDIYLVGRVPLSAVTPDEIDRLLGSVLTYADESFNRILELGFATSIRKEWEWRRARGEPTGNLDAFRGWLQKPTTSAPGGATPR